MSRHPSWAWLASDPAAAIGKEAEIRLAFADPSQFD
jgi:hypothetical protein